MASGGMGACLRCMEKLMVPEKIQHESMAGKHENRPIPRLEGTESTIVIVIYFALDQEGKDQDPLEAAYRKVASDFPDIVFMEAKVTASVEAERKAALNVKSFPAFVAFKNHGAPPFDAYEGTDMEGLRKFLAKLPKHIRKEETAFIKSLARNTFEKHPVLGGPNSEKVVHGQKKSPEGNAEKAK